VRALLPALRADPLGRSLPLDYDSRIGNLGDCRKVYFDESEATRPPGYRLVLRLLPDERQPRSIQVVSIGPRANLDAYRRAAARLGRG
jgi:hypothetical protein